MCPHSSPQADPADNLKTILVPVLVVSCVLVAAAIFAYKKLSISGVIADMRASAEKKSPPGPQKEVTLVLTDVQVSVTKGCCWVMSCAAASQEGCGFFVSRDGGTSFT